MQSKSFRILQKLTEGLEDGMYLLILILLHYNSCCINYLTHRAGRVQTVTGTEQDRQREKAAAGAQAASAVLSTACQ